MDLIHYVVKDGVIESTNDNFSSRQVKKQNNLNDDISYSIMINS